jgi:hypothetical protein
LETNKGSIPKKVLNMKIEERCPRERKKKIKMETTGYKDVTQKERKTQEEVKGQEVWEHGDGQTWLLDNPHNMEMCAEDEAMAIF